jgi:hypothetical protein
MLSAGLCHWLVFKEGFPLFHQEQLGQPSPLGDASFEIWMHHHCTFVQKEAPLPLQQKHHN